MPLFPGYLRELQTLFSSLKNEKEAEMLLDDLFTPQELETIAERWQLVKQLDAGVPQRDIAEKLGISISKITRGSRVLQYGKGGFRLLLDRLGG